MANISIPYLPTPGPGLAATLPRVAPQLAALLTFMALEEANYKKRRENVKVIISKEAERIAEADKSLRSKSSSPSGDTASDEKIIPLMWGSLGDIEFDLLAAPASMSGKEGVVYKSHAVIGEKPHVQFTGRGLREITLNIAWHSMAMADIEASFNALRDAMNAREILPLVIGDTKIGSYYDGNFVIKDMPYKVENYRDNGSILYMTLDVTLLEWNTGKPLEPGARDTPKGVKNQEATPAQRTNAANNMRVRL